MRPPRPHASSPESAVGRRTCGRRRARARAPSEGGWGADSRRCGAQLPTREGGDVGVQEATCRRRRRARGRCQRTGSGAPLPRRLSHACARRSRPGEPAGASVCRRLRVGGRSGILREDAAGSVALRCRHARASLRATGRACCDAQQTSAGAGLGYSGCTVIAMKQLDCSSTTSCWSRRGHSCPSRAGLRRVPVACVERIHLLDGRDAALTRPSRRRTCSSSGRSAAQTSARSSVRAWVATLHRRERALTAMPVERCSPCAGITY